MDAAILALWASLQGEAKPQAKPPAEVSSQRRRRRRRSPPPPPADPWLSARPIIVNPSWRTDQFLPGLPLWLRQTIPTEAEFVRDALFVRTEPKKIKTISIPKDWLPSPAELPPPAEKISSRGVLTLGQIGGMLLAVFGFVAICLSTFFRFLSRQTIRIEHG